MNRQIFILNGLPGSGKTTWVKNHVKEYPDTLVISMDDLRQHLHGGTYIYDEKLEPVIRGLSDHILEELIHSTTNNIIIDETNVRKQRRIQLINNIKFMQNAGIMPVKIDIVAVVLPETKDLLDRRMKNDRGYTREEWQGVIDKMKSYWTPVELEEGFTSIVTIK